MVDNLIAQQEVTRAPDIDDRSHSILTERPVIQFVEPEISASPIREVVAEIAVDAVTQHKNVRNFADTLSKLAAATQLKIDDYAKGFEIGLDPTVDYNVIQAIRRQYPSNDSNRITYEQYKRCKERLRQNIEESAKKFLITPDKIANAAKMPLTDIGDVNTERGRLGLNRPEVDPLSQVIQPLNMASFQEKVIKALINMIWKIGIKPILIKAGAPLSEPIRGLPDEIFPNTEVDYQSLFPQISRFLPAGTVIPSQQKPPTGAPTSAQDLVTPSRVTTGDSITFGNDCSVITKAFERGATFSSDQRSVFAMLTPHLQNAQSFSNTTRNQLDAESSIGNIRSIQELIKSQLSAGGATPPPQLDTDFAKLTRNPTAIQVQYLQQALPSPNALVAQQEQNIADKVGSIIKKCIPCSFRIFLPDQLKDLLAGLAKTFLDFLQNMLSTWLGIINDILSIIDQFRNLGSNARKGLCEFWQWLCRTMCPADLARILGLLAALMIKIALEISGVFDFMLSLVAPIIQPILSALLTLVHQFILMIIRPIECIIDSIAAQIRAFDYQYIIENFKSFEIGISLGEPQRDSSVQVPNKSAMANVPVPGLSDKQVRLGPDTVAAFPPGTPNSEKRKFFIGGNPLWFLEEVYESSAKAAKEAEAELSALQKAGENINPLDTKAVSDHRERLKSAQEKVTNARNERDKSFPDRLATTVESFKEPFQMLTGFLSEMIGVANEFERKIKDNLQKILGQFMGGTGSAVHLNLRKLAILQMIGMITALIQLLSSIPGCNCNEPESIENVAGALLKNSPVSVIRQADGSIQFTEALSDDTLNEILGIFGGQQPVIKSVGNPILDTKIAETVAILTQPVSITFRCNKQTTVADAEQVNKWIEELNQL